MHYYYFNSEITGVLIMCSSSNSPFPGEMGDDNMQLVVYILSPLQCISMVPSCDVGDFSLTIQSRKDCWNEIAFASVFPVVQLVVKWIVQYRSSIMKSQVLDCASLVMSLLDM